MADILSRGDIINSVAADTDMPSAKVSAVLKSLEGVIARQVGAGGEVRMAGFGTFKTTQRGARTSRNPRTGEPVQVAARTAPSFKAGKSLRDAAGALSGGGAQAPAKSGAKSPAKAPGKSPAKSPAKAAAKAPAKAAAKAPAKGAAKAKKK